ncbi:MAG: hypothetical protein JKY43_03270, partial [Phycisphaerales bacterium]|nr:hypothetical protein [Phycisphaerales bacterium]
PHPHPHPPNQTEGGGDEGDDMGAADEVENNEPRGIWTELGLDAIA